MKQKTYSVVVSLACLTLVAVFGAGCAKSGSSPGSVSASNSSESSAVGTEMISNGQTTVGSALAKCPAVAIPKDFEKLSSFTELFQVGRTDYRLAYARGRYGNDDGNGNDPDNLSVWASISEGKNGPVVKQGVSCYYHDAKPALNLSNIPSSGNGWTVTSRSDSAASHLNFDLTASLKFVGADWIVPQKIALHWEVENISLAKMGYKLVADGSSALEQVKALDLTQLPAGTVMDAYANSDRSQLALHVLIDMVANGTQSHKRSVNGQVVEDSKGAYQSRMQMDMLMIFQKN